MEKISYFSYIKKSFKPKNYINYAVVVAITLLLTILSLTGNIGMTNASLLVQIGYSVIGALALSLVVGFLGELSLGHAAFMSIGAYIGVYIQNTVFANLALNAPLVSLLISIMIGGLVAAVFGLIIGLPALRLKGDYLAIVTLAFGEIIKVIFQNIPAFGGAIGLSNNNFYDDNELLVICFVFIIITLIVVQNFIKSKHGRAVMAIRDNEIAASSMGVNVTFYKLITFVLSAFIAGVAGVLMGASKSIIVAREYDYNYSINLLVMVVLGGMGSINGTMVASTLITILNLKLTEYLSGDLAAIKSLIYAIILIGIVIYTNTPALKGFRAKYNLRKFYDYLARKIKLLFTKKSNNEETEQAKIKEYTADWSKIPTKIEMDAILSTDLLPDDTYVPDKSEKPSRK